MKVTTIDGGFRGLRGSRGMGALGALASETQISQGEWFNSSLQRYAATRQRFRTELSRGSIPSHDALAIETSLRTTEDALNTHLERLSQIESSAELGPWRSAAQGLIASANAVAARAEMVLGDESAVRGWKIGLGIAGAVGTVGLLAWWFTRS